MFSGFINLFNNQPNQPKTNNQPKNNEKIDEKDYLPIANVVSREEAIKIKKERILKQKEEDKIRLENFKKVKTEEMVKYILDKIDEWIFDDKDNREKIQVIYNQTNVYFNNDELKSICKHIENKLKNEVKIEYLSNGFTYIFNIYSNS